MDRKGRWGEGQSQADGEGRQEGRALKEGGREGALQEAAVQLLKRGTGRHRGILWGEGGSQFVGAQKRRGPS